MQRRVTIPSAALPMESLRKVPRSPFCALLRMTRSMRTLNYSNVPIAQLPNFSISQFISLHHPIFLSLSNSLPVENLEEVITPCAGRQSRAIRVSGLVSPATDAPTVPERLWGPRVFLGPRGFASGAYDSHSRTGRFLG